jgi:hypothetical protein
VTSPQLLCALAAQRQAELIDTAARGARPGRGRRPLRSLRERTGWTLVELGLRLATKPAEGGSRTLAQSAR